MCQNFHNRTELSSPECETVDFALIYNRFKSNNCELTRMETPEVSKFTKNPPVNYSATPSSPTKSDKLKPKQFSCNWPKVLDTKFMALLIEKNIIKKRLEKPLLKTENKILYYCEFTLNTS